MPPWTPAPPHPAETAAETYIETGPHVIAGGLWHIQPDESVIYERGDGRFEPAQVGAYTAQRSCVHAGPRARGRTNPGPWASMTWSG